MDSWQRFSETTLQDNQKALLKQSLDVNTKYIIQKPTWFLQRFFILMNNSIFVKAIANVIQHWVIKYVTTDERRSYCQSQNLYKIC